MVQEGFGHGRCGCRSGEWRGWVMAGVVQVWRVKGVVMAGEEEKGDSAWIFVV